MALCSLLPDPGECIFIVSVLGRDKGYTVKYNPLPEGVPEGESRGAPVGEGPVSRPHFTLL